MFLFFDDRRIAMTLLWAALVGIGLAVVYDFFRVARVARSLLKSDVTSVAKRKLPVRILLFSLIFLEDIVYCVFAAIVTILFVFTANKGQIRVFAIVCEVAGFTLYYFTVGRLVIKISEKLIILIRKLLRLIYKYVLTPPAKALARGAVWAWKHTYGTLQTQCKKTVERRRIRALRAYSIKREAELIADAAAGFR